jgi:hypothetical protein
MALLDWSRFLHDFLVLPRDFVLMCRMLLIFASVMLLSRAFGHLTLSFIL